jgi:hypothetical protein
MQVHGRAAAAHLQLLHLLLELCLLAPLGSQVVPESPLRRIFCLF